MGQWHPPGAWLLSACHSALALTWPHWFLAGVREVHSFRRSIPRAIACKWSLVMGPTSFQSGLMILTDHSVLSTHISHDYGFIGVTSTIFLFSADLFFLSSLLVVI